jgi:hypothetical protein
VRRQLDLFAEDEADLLRAAETAEKVYDHADRDEAEEAYGDYQLVLESIGDRLGAVRDTYAATLDEDTAEQYVLSFDHTARKRFPRVAL